MTPLRIVLADDHGVVRQGLRVLLEAESDFHVVGEAIDGPTAMELVEQLRPDVLVLDLMMPGLGGLEITRRVCRLPERPRVVVLSMHDDAAYVDEALRHGASAYVLKEASGEVLSRAIREAAAGRTYLGPPLSPAALEGYRQRLTRSELAPPHQGQLTTRERQVLQLAAEGLCAREVATRLGISARTAEAHRASFMHKLGLRTQTDIVRYALRGGLLPGPDRRDEPSAATPPGRAT
jgi:DNA-binding NarL/FixJ family response regulator